MTHRASRVALRGRATQLLAAGVALVVTAGWWVAIVELIPAADRPYIGGSQTNSVLELIFGYNGFGRLTGNETGSIGGPSGGASAAPSAGPSTVFEPDSSRDGLDGVRLARDGSDGFVSLDGGSWQDGFDALPASSPRLSGRSGADGNPQDDIDGLLNGSTPGTQLVTLLQADASRYTWVAATIGSTRAASYQLATGEPVMPVGGFNGSDPSPTLEQFQHRVALGEIHYLIGGGGFGRQNGGADTSRQIAAWVAQHFTARTIDGVTVYDLTAVAP